MTLREIATAAEAPYGVSIVDGEVWTTLVRASALVSLTGARIELPPGGSAPMVMSGPWFGASLDTGHGPRGALGRVGAEALVDVGGSVYGVAAAGGSVWFSDMATDRLGVLREDDPSRARYVDLPPGGFPAAVSVGPDGVVWCALNRAGAVAKVVGSSVTVVPLPMAQAGPVGVCAVQGGAWVVVIDTGHLVFVTATGLVRPIPLPDQAAKPHAVVVDGLDRVWFTEWGASRVGVYADGAFTHVDLPPGAEPHGLAVAEDGVWVACESGFLAHVTG
ncbi:Vgb family protein [Actinokineospora pegani]|uniref:Vgb family protein n=1 Tax=Actinokineospora pegani TaxID=2654637 RepID=UPI0012EA42E5|nr:virginiamycin B lyase [Actinokineospora pegani]